MSFSSFSRWFYLIGFFFCSCQIGFSQEKFSLFIDNFDDNQHEWVPLGDRAKTDARIESGYFYLKSKSSRTGYYRRCARAFLKKWQEYEVEIKIKQVEGDSSKGFALEWGANSAQKKVYQFWLRNDGHYAISRFDAFQGSYVDFVPWTPSPHIKIDDFNVLKVKSLKDEIIFYINGQEVYAHSPFQYFGYEIGFVSPPKAAVLVDYLHVNLLNQAPKPVLKKKYAPNIWVVLVGISQYESWDVPELAFTERDARELAAFYQNENGGGVPPEHLKILLGKEASRENILKTLGQVFDRAEEKDLVIFYFSGHGIASEDTKRDLYLLPQDYENGNLETAIKAEHIKNIFLQSKASKKIWIMDACHSGGVLPQLDNLDLVRAIDALDDSDIALITSSKAGETSLELRDEQRGLFSFYLTLGLLDESSTIDQNGDKLISIWELFNFASRKTSEIAPTLPGYQNKSQTPIIGGKFNVMTPLGEVNELKDE